MAIKKEDIRVFKKQLIAVREKLVAEIRAIAQDASKSPRDASGDLSAYTMHMADMASDTYQRELNVNLAETEQEVLYQIDEALKRVDEGTYGICMECDKAIKKSRLKAVPYAAHCIDCQREKEKTPRKRR